LTGSTLHRAAAEAALGATRVLGGRYPRAAGWGLAAAAALLAGPAEIAIVGADTGGGTVIGATTRTVAEMTDLERAAWMSTSPGAVIAIGREGGRSGEPAWAPLLEGRGLIDGLPTAYVCQQFVCLRPVTTVGELAAALNS
jgi:hypothetical protein